MSTAYLDSSALIAIEFREADFDFLLEKLVRYESIISSNLLEAEYKSACIRNKREYSNTFLSEIDWIFPDRSLASEINKILNAGYLRGADLWHVAVALYARDITVAKQDILFVTKDFKQGKVANAVGFSV